MVPRVARRCFRPAVPSTAVYLVKPRWIASIAAFFAYALFLAAAVSLLGRWLAHQWPDALGEIGWQIAALATQTQAMAKELKAMKGADPKASAQIAAAIRANGNAMIAMTLVLFTAWQPRAPPLRSSGGI